MFGIGMTEMMIVLVIILVVFGARKLPEIGSGLGKGIKSFKQGMNEDEAPAKQIGHEAKPAEDGLTPDQVKQTTDTK